MTRDVTPRFKEPRPTPRQRTKDLRAVREALERRARYGCEFPRCDRRGTEMHHRLRRSQGGSDRLSNLLLLCGDHHAYVHANPAESYQRGWLIRSGT